MTTLRLTIVGTTPLLMDKVSRATIRQLIAGKASKQKTKKEPVEKKIYRNKRGEIGIPVRMLISALNSAHSLGIEKTTLSIQEDFLVFPIQKGRKEVAWTIFRRKQEIAGKTITMLRPKFGHWGFTCTTTFNEKKIAPEKVVHLFDRAGSFEGLGSFRLRTGGAFVEGGPFGCFRVEKCEVVDRRHKKQKAAA